MREVAAVLASVVLFALGAAIVVAPALSAVQTLVVPRPSPVLLTRWVFRVVRIPFDFRGKHAKEYFEQERAMALYAPISLLSLVGAWLVLTGWGYVPMEWAPGAPALGPGVL